MSSDTDVGYELPQNPPQSNTDDYIYFASARNSESVGSDEAEYHQSPESIVTIESTLEIEEQVAVDTRNISEMTWNSTLPQKFKTREFSTLNERHFFLSINSGQGLETESSSVQTESKDPDAIPSPSPPSLSISKMESDEKTLVARMSEHIINLRSKMQSVAQALYVLKQAVITLIAERDEEVHNSKSSSMFEELNRRQKKRVSLMAKKFDELFEVLSDVDITCPVKPKEFRGLDVNSSGGLEGNFMSPDRCEKMPFDSPNDLQQPDSLTISCDSPSLDSIASRCVSQDQKEEVIRVESEPVERADGECSNFAASNMMEDSSPLSPAPRDCLKYPLVSPRIVIIVIAFLMVESFEFQSMFSISASCENLVSRTFIHRLLLALFPLPILMTA